MFKCEQVSKRERKRERENLTGSRQMTIKSSQQTLTPVGDGETMAGRARETEERCERDGGRDERRRMKIIRLAAGKTA